MSLLFFNPFDCFRAGANARRIERRLRTSQFKLKHAQINPAAASLSRSASEHRGEQLSRRQSGARGMLWRGDDVRCATFDYIARSFCKCVIVLFRTAILVSHIRYIAETALSNCLDELTVWLKEQIFGTFEEMAKENIDNTVKSEKTPLKILDIDETCASVMNKLPGALYLFGEETLTQSVRLVVTSFSHKEINKDLTFRVLDLLVVHFKRSAGVRDSFDIG
ncbi:hypothetical protein EVAR_87121_1 [Eumeta japonica]|uniref:Uncharacterized protein n=1 Tax=Eumeta variegata TaxID=151549 RepID=A0A4C1VVJ1_EUMVA|nr:hypothetical protein EVAR_87121_1 [Eumeta japonica]